MLEQVQQRAIRMITNLKGRCSENRLREVRLTTQREEKNTRHDNHVQSYDREG